MSARFAHYYSRFADWPTDQLSRKFAKRCHYPNYVHYAATDAGLASLVRPPEHGGLCPECTHVLVTNADNQCVDDDDVTRSLASRAPRAGPSPRACRTRAVAQANRKRMNAHDPSAPTPLRARCCCRRAIPCGAPPVDAPPSFGRSAAARRARPQVPARVLREDARVRQAGRADQLCAQPSGDERAVLARKGRSVGRASGRARRARGGGRWCRPALAERPTFPSARVSPLALADDGGGEVRPTAAPRRAHVGRSRRRALVAPRGGLSRVGHGGCRRRSTSARCSCRARRCLTTTSRSSRPRATKRSRASRRRRAARRSTISSPTTGERTNSERPNSASVGFDSSF